MHELKSVFEIDPANTNEDKNLLFYLEWASRWIDDFLDRPDIEKKSRTCYYNGPGTQSLLLKHRPVFESPTIQAYVDDGGFYGAPSGAFPATTALTYGTHFVLKVDDFDARTSRSGILLRIGSVWNRFYYRQRGLLTPYVGPGQGNVKVVYTAGYTVDTLPSPIRQACVTLVSAIRQQFPDGRALTSENYEDRSVSIATERKDFLFGLVKPLLIPYRNWKW